MNDCVQFVLDGKIVEARNVDPTTTVLQYLRRELRRTGTKEGCAEGDCGACTVAIGELKNEEIEYRAINACIVFLPTLNGKELVTVESLSKDGVLHPAQQAMVDCHGSQCGFCTPGFIMSLFVQYEKGARSDRNSLCDALAGNLCRCTGYGPILDAGRSMSELPAAPLRHAQAETIRLLTNISRHDGLALPYGNEGQIYHYHAPKTLDALLQLRAEYLDAVLVAGATDVGLWVTKQHRKLGTVIALNEVSDLKFVDETADGLEIGAMTPYADAHKALAQWHPDFGEVVRRLGSAQIRNSGTIGGNIANGSPIGDTMPLLIAGGARLRLRSIRGARDIPLEDFFIAYGEQDLRDDEIVERIFLPHLAKGAHFRAYKISKRFDQDISALCAAFNFTIDDGRVSAVRVAFGGMAATPKRAIKCEAALKGAEWSRASIETAAAVLSEDFVPITDMRASADYRMTAAENLLRKAFLEFDGAEARVLKPVAVAHG